MKMLDTFTKRRVVATVAATIVAAFAFVVAGCASSGPSSPLVGSWIAGADGSAIPENSSVLLTFRENGAYTLITRHAGHESRANGNYSATKKTLKFDDKTSYRYEIDKKAGTLTMRFDDDPASPATTYRRVVLELEPAATP